MKDYDTIKNINNIYNKKYSEDIKDIPLPALAAYYGDVELTQNLINEPREGVTNPWNFNQTLGKRPETPLAYAMTSSTEEGQKKLECKKLEDNKIIDKNNSLLGVKFNLTSSYSDKLQGIIFKYDLLSDKVIEFFLAN